MAVIQWDAVGFQALTTPAVDGGVKVKLQGAQDVRFVGHKISGACPPRQDVVNQKRGVGGMISCRLFFPAPGTHFQTK